MKLKDEIHGDKSVFRQKCSEKIELMFTVDHKY